MNRLFLFVCFFCLSKSNFSQDRKCQIQQKTDSNAITFTANIEGDHGVVIQGMQVNTGIINCGVCIIMQERNSKEDPNRDTLYIVHNLDTGRNKDTVLQLQAARNEQKQEIALSEILGMSKYLPCNDAFLYDKAKFAEDLNVWRSKDEKTIVIQLTTTDLELEKFNLIRRWDEKDGVTRIKELNKYYFLDSVGKPLVLKNGEAERYDTATDFNNGTAIVGLKSPNMAFQMITKKGTKSSFTFEGFEEHFAGNSDLIKISDISETLNHSVIFADNLRDTHYGDLLINRQMEKLTQPLSNISSFNNFIKISGFEIKGTDYSGVCLFKYESGKIQQVMPSYYYSIESFGNSLIYVEYLKYRKGKRYALLDSKDDFKAIFESSYPIEVARVDSTGVEFNTEFSHDYNNKYGYFDENYRKLIAPGYANFGQYNKFGFIKSTKYLGVDKNEYGYLDSAGNAIFSNYEDMDDSPDSSGYIRVKQNNQWGVIDIYGNYVIKPEFQNISHFNNRNLAWVCSPDYHLGFVDTKGVFTNLEISAYSDWPYDSMPDFSKSGVTVLGNGYPNHKSSEFYLVSYNKGVLIKRNEKKLYILESGMKDISLVTDSENVNMYIKDGDIFPRDGGKVIHPFKNNYAIAMCRDGGSYLLDSLGNNAFDNGCLPYDSLSEVIKSSYVIAFKDKLQGIIKINTGEVIVPVSLDKIELVNGVFLCKIGDTSFTLGFPKNSGKLFECLNRVSCEVYERLLKPQSF